MGSTPANTRPTISTAGAECAARKLAGTVPMIETNSWLNIEVDPVARRISSGRARRISHMA